MRFDANGGTGNEPLQVSVIYDAPAVTLPENTFTHRGYSFAGWNTKPDGSGTAYEDKAEISNITASITLYAQWTLDTYTITYEYAGGTAPVNPGNPASYTVESEITLQAPTRTGYTFAGWMNMSTSETVAIIPRGSTGNMSLTAQWETVPYTITYKTDGGSPIAAGSYTIEEGVTLPTNTTKEGYLFDGWTEEGKTDKVTAISAGATGDKTYKANWKPITYTVKLTSTNGIDKHGDGREQLYNQLGGSGKIVEYGQSISITGVSGLTGFSTSSGVVQTTFTNLTTTQGEIIILTPMWSRGEGNGSEYEPCC